MQKAKSELAAVMKSAQRVLVALDEIRDCACEKDPAIVKDEICAIFNKANTEQMRVTRFLYHLEKLISVFESVSDLL